MKSSSHKRPSPAMVVAVIALSLGLTGSALAGAGNLSKAKVKQIATKQIKKQAPKLSVANAKTADRATNVYAANVNADGTILGSVPGDVTSTKVATGVYRVTFPRAVTGCLVFSAFGSNDGTVQTGSTGAIPATGEDPNRVAVATYSGNGASEDRDFYVQITCP